MSTQSAPLAPIVTPVFHEQPDTESIRRWFDERQEAHFPSLAGGPGPNSFFEPSHDYAGKMLSGIDLGWNILDVGCGYGWDAIALSMTTNRVWGIDISPRRIEAAAANIEGANKADQVSLQQMDAHSLDFPDNCFDLIVANSFLMWVHKDQVLRECHRVLKPGGHVLFSMETMKENPFLKIHRSRPEKRAREEMVSRITLGDIRGLSHNFSSVTARQFYLFSPILYPLALRRPRSQTLRWMTRTMQSLDAVVLNCISSLRRYAWVSVIRFTK